MDRQNLNGKVALITGGSTEVAGEVALALGREGVKIYLCGKQVDLLEIASKKIEQSGGICMTCASELDTLEAAESVLQEAIAGYGQIDILVLVSPFWAGGFIHNHNIKTWDLVLQANLREPFLMSRAALPILREQMHGEIIAIGSDSATGIYEQDGAYGVAMHALTTLMELIRKENQEYGIRTHILAPGVALTTDKDSSGQPTLTTSNVAEWVIWLLTRPSHLRSNGVILV